MRSLEEDLEDFERLTRALRMQLPIGYTAQTRSLIQRLVDEIARLQEELDWQRELRWDDAASHEEA